MTLSAEQRAAVRQQTIEECARAFEAETATWKAWPQAGAARRLGAKAIRALLSEQPEAALSDEDEQIDALLNRLDEIARDHDSYEYGLPLIDYEGSPLPALRDAVRAALSRGEVCSECHGTREVLDHADACDSDLCALNGDMHSCAGKMAPCSACTVDLAEMERIANPKEAKQRAAMWTEQDGSGVSDLGGQIA